MRNTKLILIEGVPGSGKSTLAQFITHSLARSVIPCRWWYEEEKNHPVYVFHDRASLKHTVDLLSAGYYLQVVEEAIDKWKTFVQALQSSEMVVILDGCLFGYLTWSLFPLDIPLEEIQSYLTQVELIMADINPCLIYLYQQDLAPALEKICQRRGGETRSWLMTQATQSPYGQRRSLKDFDGTVTYWKDFRFLIETAFAQFNAPRLTLENSAGDWSTYERNVLDFLDLPVQEDAGVSLAVYNRYVGTYHCREGENQQVCLVQIENDHLIVDGIHQVWPRTRLIPRSLNIFAIESLPFQVAFEEDAHSVIDRMIVTGPELLSGSVECIFLRGKEP